MDNKGHCISTTSFATSFYHVLQKFCHFCPDRVKEIRDVLTTLMSYEREKLSTSVLLHIKEKSPKIVIFLSVMLGNASE